MQRSVRPMLRAAAVLVLAALPLAAQAQSYRCVGKDGKKYYGQNMPPQCAGLPVEQLNAQGVVVKRIDPQATAEQRAQKKADAAERRKQQAQAKEEGRRDHALLATYANVEEIDIVRARALAGNQRSVQALETRVAALKRQQAALAGKNDAKSKGDLRNVEFDLKTQQDLLMMKRKEAETINARYDEDKQRYLELTARGK